jgi:hypothetical protein
VVSVAVLSSAFKSQARVSPLSASSVADLPAPSADGTAEVAEGVAATLALATGAWDTDGDVVAVNEGVSDFDGDNVVDRVFDGVTV